MSVEDCERYTVGFQVLFDKERFLSLVCECERLFL
jgi:hypothetical protein